MSNQEDGTLRIKNVNITLSDTEWTCLRILFPKSINFHTQTCTLTQGDIYLLKDKLRNVVDSATRQFGEDLLQMVQKEDALQINISKQHESTADNPPDEG